MDTKTQIVVSAEREFDCNGFAATGMDRLTQAAEVSSRTLYKHVGSKTALIVAVVWEWRHPDPVVEIRLLRDRNFALASIFYFLFGFALFGSTVLIPQMLQQLYGYTATDAGLVLGPGALVIVVLAPVVVSLLPKSARGH